jgi:CRISPR/Cas system-associated exonuclease Cas4 (RecB family)
MSVLPQAFAYSQSSLSAYAQCKRRFFLRYARRLEWPAAMTLEAEAREEAIGRGLLFHHLAHQQAVGVEVEETVRQSGDALLREWWRNFREKPPPLPEGRTLVEVQLSVPLGKARLVARYDRVVLGRDGRACIVDWKTGQQQPQQSDYENNWQTLVYRYALVEGGSVLTGGTQVPPERVWLVYWHAHYPEALRPVAYSAKEHQEARHRLEEVVAQIGGLEGEEDFPKTEDLEQCQRCAYQAYCGRGRGPALEWEIDEEELGWEFIPETGFDEGV